MKNNFNIIVICLLISILASCVSDKFDVDVSKINVDLKIKRFDQELFSFNPDSINKYIPVLQNRYGDFFSLFCNEIINIGGYENKYFPEYLKAFITDVNIKEIHKQCKNKFKNIDDIENDLTSAFKHYKYYFPQAKTPNVYTYISGFNQSIVIADNILGIGLDKYMGKSYDYYSKLQLPKYMRIKMNKGMIVPDCMKAWSYSEFQFKDSANNLIDNMIYQGKIMYLLDALLPDLPDTMKIGYTEDQLKWCDKNKKNMWLFLIDHKLLFITNYIEIKKFIDDGPNTSLFTNKSPSRTGIWLGWQIVKSYMNNNPDVTINQLMNDNDYQGILNKSKFKP